MTSRYVLIVEDEKPLAHALMLKLQHEGIKAVIAENGEDALKILQSTPIDLVLLDLMMPVMDGFQVLEKMPELQNKPKVFVLSNLSVPDDKNRALALGAQKYFVKSDTPLTTLIEEIKKV